MVNVKGAVAVKTGAAVAVTCGKQVATKQVRLISAGSTTTPVTHTDATVSISNPCQQHRDQDCGAEYKNQSIDTELCAIHPKKLLLQISEPADRNVPPEQ